MADCRRSVLALSVLGLLAAAGCGSAGGTTTASATLTPDALHQLNVAAAEFQAGRKTPASSGHVRVPQLIGLHFGAAVRAAHAAGLRQGARMFPGTLGNPAYRGNCKVVSSQSPAPGVVVRPGTQVSITYGVCKQTISRG